MKKKINYLGKLKANCPHVVIGDDLDMTVPHQSISPREILESWVKNDAETEIHTPVEDWHGGDVHPNSIREFEDDFEAMEYVADMTSQPVTMDNVGNPTPADPSPVEPPPAEPSPAE